MTISRFLTAQDRGCPSAYRRAIQELTSGQKQSHWIWYILPQHVLLGRSHLSIFYGIRDLAEAKDYIDHPILSQRLRSVISVIESNVACTADLRHLMGSEIDAIKATSSLTLFKAAGLDSAMLLLDKLEISCESTERLLL